MGGKCASAGEVGGCVKQEHVKGGENRGLGMKKAHKFSKKRLCVRRLSYSFSVACRENSV